TSAYSARAKQQLHLLATLGLDHFPATEDVALLSRHRHGAFLLVALLYAPQPFLVETDTAVVLAEDRPELSVRTSEEADIVRSGVEMLTPDDDVRPLRPLVAVITEQGSAVSMHLDGKPERFEGSNQRTLFRQLRFEAVVFGHFENLTSVVSNDAAVAIVVSRPRLLARRA